jgi:Uma2 family endonuclease
MTRTVQKAVMLLPLESGDRLTRAEFERRYEAMPHLKKAELIEGVVLMPSPIRNRHSEAHGHLMVWLGTYCAATPGTFLNDNATVRLDQDNVVQPDALLRLDEGLGGRSRISQDDYIEGAPELIAEVAASSASYDLHDKLNVYRRNGVQEYVVWRVYDEAIDWFRWQEGRYAPLEPDAEGVLHSQVFPGLRLDAAAMLNGDLARALAVAQGGVETEAHRAFVARLADQEE